MTDSTGRPNVIQRYLLSGDVYYGWFIVVECFFVLLSVFGTITAFSVFFSHVVATFETSHADTSIAFSLQMITTYGSLSVLGFAVDRFSVSHLATVGAVLVGGGLIGSSTASSFLGLVVAYGLVAGLGFGLSLIIGYTTPVKWFDQRRGLATGIAVSGGGVGILPVPPLSAWLIDGYGWQTAYLLVGVGAFLVPALAGRIVVDSPRTLDLDPHDEFPDGDVPAATTSSSVGA
jgi:MFS family permease